MIVKVKERVEEQQQRLLDLQRQEASEGERPSEAYNGELENTETRGVMVVFCQMKYGELISRSMEETCTMNQFLPKHG